MRADGVEGDARAEELAQQAQVAGEGLDRMGRTALFLECLLPGAQRSAERGIGAEAGAAVGRSGRVGVRSSEQR